MSNQSILLDIVMNKYCEDAGFKDLSKGFERFATEQIFKDYDLDIEEIEQGLIGASKDGGVDGFYIFLNNELIHDIHSIPNVKSAILDIFLLQYKNSTSIEDLVLDRFMGSSDFIFNLSSVEGSLDGLFSTDLIEKIRLFHKSWLAIANKHPQINVHILHVCKGDKTKTLGPKNENISYIRKLDRLKSKVLDIAGDGVNVNYEIIDIAGDGVNVNYEIIDANDLLNYNRQEKSYSLNLKLNENPIAIDYLETDQRGYIASVNIYDYYQFLRNDDGSLRKYLFEANIRDYQKGTSVNDEISNSVEHEKNFDFWWLNNGVTIIAEKGTLTGKVLHLDNIQIVNGLQTSQTIFNVLSTGNYTGDKRSLMLKIIITDNKNTMDAIIKSTNSQNAVPAASLRATDPRQREIEEYFLSKGFYYDRRKNFYKNAGRPRKDIISISYLSQCLTALLAKNPSKARSNPTTLTKSESDYKRIFNEGRSLETYYKAVRLTKNIESYLKENFTPEDSLEEELGSNFRFHISRSLISILLDKSNYTDRDFLNIDLNEITDEHILKAIKKLKNLLTIYKIDNPKQSNVNISKTVGFSEYITENIIKYQNENLSIFD